MQQRPTLDLLKENNWKSTGGQIDPVIIPITDAPHQLLPIHFECDPGPDFSWWSDEDDLKIATKTAVNDEERLKMICK